MRNVMEDIVKRVYVELLPSAPDPCNCDLCREDVMVYALNRLPAHYVVTLRGQVLSELEMNADQSRADVAIALMEGFETVGASPRCGRKPAAMS
ncbi:MAG: late competence development ComFB family protein [Gemmatimonadales bacterium]|nr:late competence development ComFB family protein [Gemmatimonadales bacterium]